MVAAAIGCGKRQTVELVAVGHRVVHGGPDYDRPVVVDATFCARLEQLVPLAPLHQPNNLAPIRSLRRAVRICRRSPASTPHFIAVTAAVADHYAIPEHFYREGVRRYGFHGLSYEFIAGRLCEVAPSSPKDA